MAGEEGVIAAATHEEVNFVISALVGAAGLLPTYRAIEAGKGIALANKEVLVAAGELIMDLALRKNVPLLPLDSEHNALFQCLQGEKKEEVQKAILTASGGPFLQTPQEQLKAITPEKALIHPNWKMGRKLTIDSSTLMNKGFEVIEAHHLFGLTLEQIEVVIHPQSIVHSFIEYVDGSLKAQLSEPDMKLPIQYALTYPERKKGTLPCFDFRKHSKLEFFSPNREKFPCLRLAYEAIEEGGTLPCFMNGANEILVKRFLEKKISYLDIGRKLESLMNRHRSVEVNTLEVVFSVDKEARDRAERI